MIKQLTYLIIILFMAFAGCTDTSEVKVPTPACSAGSNASTFELNGQTREYLLYKPDNLPANAPLVFVLHGYTQNAELFFSMGMNRVADTGNFAVCYPQGLFCTWNITSHNSTDVEFLKGLAQYLQSQHNLNPNKTFATGFSMGGALCNLLALDAGDVFSAVAPVAGYVMENVWSTKNPQYIIPYLAIHGTSDQIVSIHGVGANDPSIQEIVNFWCMGNNCSVTDTVQLTTNTVIYKSSNGNNGHEVWYYKISGQNHVFPGDRFAMPGTDVSGFNGWSEIWKFFRKY